MLDQNVNINFYMFFGGTNFGFTAGANDGGIGKYEPDLTSYDYDAPMDEAGNIDISIILTLYLRKIHDYLKPKFSSMLPSIF